MSPNAIDHAFQRVEAFAQVHQGKDMEEVEDAFGVFLTSFGITDEMREHLNERLVDYHPNPIILGFMSVGVILGLAMSEYDNEYA